MLLVLIMWPLQYEQLKITRARPWSLDNILCLDTSGTVAAGCREVSSQVAREQRRSGAETGPTYLGSSAKLGQFAWIPFLRFS